MPIPPARTAPCTRVTTGLANVTIRRWSSTSTPAAFSIPPPPSPPGPSPLASDRSAPEQNVRPSARISTTLTSASSSARPSPSYSSETSCLDSALRLCR